MRIPSFFIALIFACAAIDAAQAKVLSPIGSWKGGGSITPVSSQPERTLCRATISAAGRNRYNAHLVCSTGGTKYTGSAILQRNGASQFSGDFSSSQYDVRGSASAEMNDRSNMLVTLRSNKGAGTLAMKRQ